MAKIAELNEEGWNAWVESRPESVQKLAQTLKPNVLYRLKSGGQRCTIYSFCEDGTVSVNVTGEFNRVLFSRRVFGIKPDDLEECDLPEPGEDLGDTAQEAGYTQDDIINILIPKLREQEPQP